MALSEQQRKLIAARARAKKPQSEVPVNGPRKIDHSRTRKILEDHEFSDTVPLPVGKSKIAVMHNPPPFDDLWYYPVVSVWIPTMGDADVKKKKFISVRSKDSFATCVASEVYNAVKRNPKRFDPGIVRAVEEIRPSERFVSNVLMAPFSSKDWRVVQLEYPLMVFKVIAKTVDDSLEPEDIDKSGRIDPVGVIDFMNPRVVVVDKTGQGMSTKYNVTITDRQVKFTTEQLGERRDMSHLCVESDQDELTRCLCDFIGVSDLSQILGEDIASSMSAAGATEAQIGSTVDSHSDDVGADSMVPIDDDVPDCIGDYSAAREEERNCSACSFETDCKQVQAEV